MAPLHDGISWRLSMNLAFVIRASARLSSPDRLKPGLQAGGSLLPARATFNRGKLAAVAGIAFAWLAHAAPAAGALERMAGPLLNHRFEADSEVSWSSDIVLWESGARFEQERSRLRWDAAFTHSSYDADYRRFRPFDLFGFDQSLHEDRYAGQATLRPQLTDALTLIFSGGAYDGFQDYRRVWIDNYYRQQYSRPGRPRVPGYQAADPMGWNAAGGCRWEYWPARGFLEVRGGYNADVVAPGYVLDFARTPPLTRGRDTLRTASLKVSCENVLGGRWRMLHELQAGRTTEREARLSWQGTIHFAPGARWVLRGYGGYTREAPQFEAGWLGAGVEFEVTRHVTLRTSGPKSSRIFGAA